MTQTVLLVNITAMRLEIRNWGFPYQTGAQRGAKMKKVVSWELINLI